MNSIYDCKDVFNPTGLDLKIPFYMKIILLFSKTYVSKDFIIDSKKGELWTECEYKKFKGKIYITNFKHYYIQRYSHLMKGNNK